MVLRQSNIAVITKALSLRRSVKIPAHDPISIDQAEKCRQLLEKLRARMQTRTGYKRLAVLIAFFTMYVMALLLQQRVEDSFSIESRYAYLSRNDGMHL
jgi:hypothetical protein